MQAPWRVELFGWVRAVSGDRVVSKFRTQRAGLLLAFLALHRNRVCTREELCEVLWPDSDPELTRKRLSEVLASLRRQLEPPEFGRGSVIQADHSVIRLREESVVTDVDEFKTLFRRALDAPTPEQSVTLLRSAIELIRGELMPGFHEDWVYEERRRLGDAYALALGKLVDTYQSTNQIDQALVYARKLVDLDPLQEDAQESLIRLYAHAGQVELGRRQLEEYAETVRRELNAEPSPELGEILNSPRPKHRPSDSIPFPLTDSPKGEPLIAPSRARTSSNLPLPLTRFFGREEEIAALQELFRDPAVRLITLTGPGGIGKTRLALEAARAFTAEAPAWFVPLVDISDAEEIPSAMRLTMGMKDATDLAEIASRLHDMGGGVLVLDNFEHLVEPGASLIAELLWKAPELTCLVTSRQQLAIDGEHIVSVAPLSCPDFAGYAPNEPSDLAHWPSIRMFLDRTQAVRADFQLTERNAEVIAHICERLEGIPLAIELAAAWAHSLSPSQILAQLNERFELLVSRRRDVHARHKTLRTAVEQSFEQLSPEHRHFFARLSVFRGGFTVGTLSEVVGPVLPGLGASKIRDLLADLLEKSMLQMQDSASQNRSLLDSIEQLVQLPTEAAERTAVTEVRYRLLETLREFGEEVLDEDERRTLRAQHARFFKQYAEQQRKDYLEVEFTEYARTIREEYANLLFALQWLHDEGLYKEAFGLMRAVDAFWLSKNAMREGRRWVQRMTELAEDGHLEKLDLAYLYKLSGLIWERDGADVHRANTFHHCALHLYRELGNLKGEGDVMNNLGVHFLEAGQLEDARESLLAGIELHDNACDMKGVAIGLTNLATIDNQENRHDSAINHSERAIALYEKLGDASWVLRERQNLAIYYAKKGNLDLAFRTNFEALEQYMASNYEQGVMDVFMSLGWLSYLQGDYRRAEQFKKEALRRLYAAERWNDVEWCLRQLGESAIKQGHLQRAARLFAAAENLCKTFNVQLKPLDVESVQLATSEIKQRLGESFDLEWISGRALSTNAAIRYALGQSPTQSRGKG